MELFIALFGIIYYLLKYKGEKMAHEAHEAEFRRSIADNEARERRWNSRVTNERLEAELRKELRRPGKETLRELGASGFYSPLYPVVSTDQNIPDELRILLANRGYIPAKDAGSGIRVHFRGRTQEEVERSYERQKEFLLFIDGKLREHGKCYDMYFDARGKFYRFPFSKIPIPNGVLSVGIIKWEPMVSKFDLEHHVIKL